MSDGSLSQDEIDALLQGGDDMDLSTAPEPASAAAGSGLSSGEQQAFLQLAADFSKSQSSNLSGMIGKDVAIGQPELEVISNGSFVSSLPEQIVQISADFSGGVTGAHSFIFKPDIAANLAGLMMGQEEVELNEAALSALEEAGNSMAGAEAATMGEHAGSPVESQPSQSRTMANQNVAVPDGQFVKVVYPVTVEGEEPSEMIEIFELSIAKQLTVSSSGDASIGGQTVPAGLNAGGDLGGLGLADGGDNLFADLGGQAMTGMTNQGGPNVQSVQFPSLTGGGDGSDQGNIGLLMDVSMEMTVELGRTKKLIRDILAMGEGTIIELDKLAGEPVDILVNHKLIAKGEVVVIDENFGVRVTEIVDTIERVSEM